MGFTDNSKLSQNARDLIALPKATVWVSAANVWEIAIKHSLGRGDMPVSSRDAMRYFQESGYRFLAVEAEHTIAVEELHLHHQDPFDRILIAQALGEPMRLMTHDTLVALYNDTIIKT
ncbi:type II toxin-antitoxin system VapC family toxin [Methylotuvimicrobium sp. KM1]|uniref:type II toxin-antitoxin system VapC family toxin n=1 Tax=Methylotuvimicrobium sp. KM1 TaxID=3377707 RepID=UPI003850AC7A